MRSALPEGNPLALGLGQAAESSSLSGEGPWQEMREEACSMLFTCQGRLKGYSCPLGSPGG